VIDFVASDDPRTKQLPDVSQNIDFIPTRRLYLPVDTAKVLSNGTIARGKEDEVVGQVAWELEPERSYITKNHLMILDLLATNNWERPVYYAITVSEDNYLNLGNYFQMEGLAYRIVPIVSEGDMFSRSGINTDAMYDNMVNKFRWGGVQDPDVYLDENITRMLGNFRHSFSRLAMQLIAENKRDSARKTLDKCLEVIPDEAVPYNIYNLLMMQGYYQLGDTVKANSIADRIKTNVYQDMDYFLSLGKKYNNALMYEKRVAFYSLDEIRRMATEFKQPALAIEMEQKLQEYAASLSIPM